VRAHTTTRITGRPGGTVRIAGGHDRRT
jgi:hypothetical protein